MHMMSESTEISHNFKKDGFRRAREALRAGTRMTLPVEAGFVREEDSPNS